MSLITKCVLICQNCPTPFSQTSQNAHIVQKCPLSEMSWLSSLSKISKFSKRCPHLPKCFYFLKMFPKWRIPPSKVKKPSPSTTVSFSVQYVDERPIHANTLLWKGTKALQRFYCQNPNSLIRIHTHHMVWKPLKIKHCSWFHRQER